MKKILMLSVLMVIVCMNTLGQIEKPITKGYVIVGWDLSFKADKYDWEAPGYFDKRDRLHFNTDLSFGYFVFNQFAIGLKAGVVLNRDILVATDEKLITQDLQLKSFIRYYTSFGIFVEADIGYGFGTTNSCITGTRTNDFNSFTWSSGLGYGLFLNRNLAIESKVLYKKWRREESYSEVKEETSGVYLIIGFQIYLSTRKTKIANLNE
jgi:hypothetical protein